MSPLVLSLFLASVATMAGCVDGRSPDVTGGQLVAGTEELDYLGGSSFSLSPDGRWLLFARDTVSEPLGWEATLQDFFRRTYESYVLLDLETGDTVRFGLAEDVVALLDREVSIHRRGGCWVPTADGWQGSLGMAIDGHLGFVPGAGEALWRILPADDDVVRASCGVIVPHVSRPVRIGDFLIEEVFGERVRIVDAADPDRVLADHRATRLIGHVAISDVHLSPDGTRLAYVVHTESFGFARDSQGYVLEVTPEGPRTHFLSPRLSAPRWAADGTALFANAWDANGRPAVFRWSMPLE